MTGTNNGNYGVYHLNFRYSAHLLLRVTAVRSTHIYKVRYGQLRLSEALNFDRVGSIADVAQLVEQRHGKA